MNLIQLQPDDVLVLRCPGSMSQAQRDAALAGLCDYLGPDRKVIFLDAGEALDVLRKPALPAQTGTDETSVKVEIDKTMIGKVLEPGCMLLSPDAVAHLIERTGLTTADLESMGAIPHVGEDEPVGRLEPHVWLWPGDVDADQMPYGHHPDGRVALRVDDLTEGQRRMSVVEAQLAKLHFNNIL